MWFFPCRILAQNSAEIAESLVQVDLFCIDSMRGCVCNQGCGCDCSCKCGFGSECVVFLLVWLYMWCTCKCGCKCL